MLSVAESNKNLDSWLNIELIKMGIQQTLMCWFIWRAAFWLE